MASKYPYIIHDGKKYAPYLPGCGPTIMQKDDDDLEKKRQDIMEQLEMLRRDANDNTPSSPSHGNGHTNVKRNGCPFSSRHSPDENMDTAESSRVVSPYYLASDADESDTERDNSQNGDQNHNSADDIAISVAQELENVEQPVFKTVLDRMENDHFESLPAGWTRVTHNSGMPLYLHRDTRVITFARPYFIGPQSVRSHIVPLSAIPCFQQKRIREREAAKQEELKNMTTHENPLIKSIQSSGMTIERFEDSRISPPELTQYCSSLYAFKQIKVRKYMNFKDKKLEKQAYKTEMMLREAGVTKDDFKDDEMTTVTGSGVALINIPTQDNRFHKKTFVMNPTGRSSVTILHEYVQRALKGRVLYDFNEAANTPQPYTAVAKLFLKRKIRVQLASSIKEKLEILQMKSDDGTGDEDQLILGTGMGSSKKNAKAVAAEEAVHLLIPGITFDRDHLASLQTNGQEQESYDDKAIKIFDKMEVNDKRVLDLCTRSGLPKPYHCVKEACQRLSHLQGEEPQCHNTLLGERKTEVTLTVGAFVTKATANGAKVAKQYAAQEMLKLFHPDAKHYGVILRIYANAKEKHDRKEHSRHHDEVISLQNVGPKSEPNKAIVRKLREEMMAAADPVIPRRFGAKRPFPAVNPFHRNG